MGQVSFSVPQTGQWTVTGSLNGQTITQTVNVTDKNAVYPIELLFNSASITVISPVGTSLLLQNGTNQLTKISTGTDVFIVTAMGTWTISGTLEGYTLNSTSVTVQNGGEYQTQLSIQIAALTVNAPSGTIVTVSGNGQQNEQTVTSTSVVFNLTALDTYTVSGTNGSFVTSTEMVDVTSFQPYNVTLTLSIATITVTTVAGTLVQAQNGTTTLSGTATDGTITFETQTFGTWNISGTLSGYTFPQQSANVQAYQDYTVNLQPSVATLTVTAPEGTYITAQSSDAIYYGIAIGTSAEIPIYVLGEYTVSGENNGLVSDTQTVDITEFTAYSTTLTIWSATITVTTPTGTTVTATNGDTELSETSYNGTAVFTVQKTGTWTLSASFDTQNATDTVNVTQQQTNYTATLRVPTIVVTTVSGSIVTCTQSTTVLTKTAQENNVYFYPPTTGEWVLNATLNQQSSNTVTVNVQENKNYPLQLNYEFATITVNTLDGVEVTAQNGSIVIVQTATSGTAVFEIATLGEWTVSATVNGQPMSDTVNVSDTIDYEITLIPVETATYIGEIAPLSTERQNFAGTSIGGNALFGGGANVSSGLLNSVEAYNSTLSKISAPNLSVARGSISAASNNGYALFVGGGSDSGASSSVDAYNTSLTRTLASPLSIGRSYICSVGFGDYVISAGGSWGSTDYSTADCYNSSLTKQTIDSLYQKKAFFSGESVGNSAIFAGGYASDSGTMSSTDGYDSSLTHFSPPYLSVSCYSLISATVGDYAIFACGGKPAPITTVNVFNSSLTLVSADDLSTSRMDGAAGSTNKYAIFCGDSLNYVCDVYNSSLTKTTATDPNSSRRLLASATAGNYALFAGGYRSPKVLNIVTAYTD